jgi:hypothetical protein
MEKVIVKDMQGIYDLYQDFANELGLVGWKYGARPEIGKEYCVIERVKHPDAGKKVCKHLDYYITTEDILVLAGPDGEQFLIEENCTEVIKGDGKNE